MELTLTAIIAVITGLIGLVVWSVRLESKGKSNESEIERILKFELPSISKKLDELENETYKHFMDEKRHYNEQFFNEFRNNVDRQFKGLEGQIQNVINLLKNQ